MIPYKLIIRLLLLIAVALFAGLLVSRCSKQKEYKETGRHNWKSEVIPVSPDTFYVAKMEPVLSTKSVAIPSTIKVQTVPDSAMRKKAEKGTILLSVTRKKAQIKGLFNRPIGVDSLQIRTIDPQGEIQEMSYPARWVDLGKWTADSTGLHIDTVEFAKDQKKARRREKWRKIGRTALRTVIGAGLLYGGYQVGKAL